MELSGKIAVVTGGAAGCGAAICERFAEEGADVVVADIDGTGARRVAMKVGGTSVEADVGVEREIANLVDVTLHKYGRIDVFCSNAGIMWGPGDEGSNRGGINAPYRAWSKLWDVNVMAHVFAAKAVLPHMVERGDGYLVANASAAGLLTSLENAPYATSKHAVVGLTEWLAITYGGSGVRFSCICSEGVHTSMLWESHGEWFAEAGAITPLALADSLIESMRKEEFLVLPHPRVAEYFRGKAADYNRWVSKMQHLQSKSPF